MKIDSFKVNVTIFWSSWDELWWLGKKIQVNQEQIDYQFWFACAILVYMRYAI